MDETVRPLLRLKHLCGIDGRDRGNQPDSKFTETLHSAAHSRSCFSLSWSPGGTPPEKGGLGLLASGGGDGKIIIWQIYVPQTSTNDMANGDEKPKARMIPIAAMRDAHGVSDVNCVGWCLREDGRGVGMLASAGDDGGVRVWRVAGDD